MTDQKIGLTLDASLDPSGVLSAIKTIQNGFNGLKIDPKLMNGLSKEFEKVNTLITKYQSQLAKGVNTKTDAKNLAKTGSEIQSSLNNIVKGIQEVNSTSITLKVEDANQLKTLEDNLKNIKKQIQDTFQQKIDTSGLTDALTKFAGGTGRAKSVQNLVNRAEVALERQELEKFSNLLDEIKGKLSGYKGSTLVSIGKALGLEGLSENNVTGSIEKITDKINELKTKATEAGESIKGLKEKEEAAAKAVNNFKPDAIARGAKEIDGLATKAQQVPPAFNQIRQAAENAASGILDAKTQVDQLKQSTQYFFSLRNMINLLKRGIREAVDVVKELDAAMTETAVVTDFSVGDMWAKLPEYTANANALGATVKDMYKATTLYYQQGLNTEQAMGIANETMKMARIGGLEAADATDKMTAALRGFNMEINELSAQRVNDVYSNLAAKTASNTEELGTAMQRTASIAASAGMSFEGTAAFLAQAIETTREPAENLGTAMKTIVARFTELKKNPLEITEVDGEEVDYNKVDTALKSIGVSLKDANGQFRNLDQVFLDISQRWDSLTQTQQRYVATTAAGSRQQSRFIAMMSNYERTMQLMDFANNSAGASNEQFGKTMESLEAKIHKLQNAWNEFLMGIMDSSWIKGLTDGITTVLDKTNKLINFLSGGGKLKGVKSFLSLFTAFTGLRLAGRGVNALIGGLGKFIDPTSKRGFLGIGGGAGAQGIAGKITLPIVAKLNELIGVVKGQKTLDKTITSTLAQYKNAANLLRMPQTVGTMRSTLGQLSNEHAYAAYINSPGTASAMQRSAMEWLNTQALDSETKQVGAQLMSSIFKGMQKNQISVKKGAELVGKPQLWGKYLGTETARQFSKNYIKVQRAQQAPLIKSAQQQAADMAWKAFGGSAFATDEGKKSLYAKNKDLRNLYKKYYKQIRQDQKQKISLDAKNINPQPYEQLANKVGILGSNFTAAGYSMQMFGAQLGQLSPGLAGVGNLISRLGIFASTSGMAIGALGKTYTQIIGRITRGVEAARLVKYGDTIGGLINSGQVAKNGMLAKAGAKAAGASNAQVGKGFVSGLTEGIPTSLLAAGLITIFVGAIAAIGKHIEKQAQEAGEKVRKNFEEGFTKKEEKIQSLESYKNRFNELAKGVDQFGHNVSLSTEEYDEYLNISRELKDLSPSLIAGYNAEGEAIIKKGEAIQEVIDKLKEEKQIELDLFTSNTSIDKLIGEYQTSDAYKNYKRNKGGTIYRTSTFDKEIKKIASLNDNNLDFKLLDSVNQLTGWDLTSFSTVTASQLKWLSTHYNDVINLVEERNGQLDDKVKEGYKDAFTNAGVAIKDVMTEGKPIIDAMQMWLGTTGIDAVGLGLGEEFGDSFNQGFEDIMLTGLSDRWNADEFKTSLKDYSKDWQDLAGSTSKYVKIMEEAQNIQDEYLDTIESDGAVNKYNNDIINTYNDLLELANGTSTATEAGKAFQQQCIAQANALRTFADEGGIALSETLNTATDAISEAESALESFNEATKKDFYTAAEDMRSIYDKIFETYKDSYGNELTKHTEGEGDNTFWTGAEALLSENKLSGGVDEVTKSLKKLEPWLREGKEGMDAFFMDVINNDKLKKLQDEGLIKLDENGWFKEIPEDQWKAVADALGISENLLTSMLNKARQFGLISFDNLERARGALSASESTITGINEDAKGKKALYVKEDTMRQNLREAGYSTKESQDKVIERLLNEQNVHMVKTMDNLSSNTAKKLVEAWGIKDLSDLITKMSETGDYNREEILDLAEKANLGSGESAENLYDEIVQAMENPELAAQTSELQSINAKLATIVDAESGKGVEDHEKARLDAYEKVLGANGIATNFANGLDADGNVLSKGAFATIRSELEKTKAEYEENAAYYAERAKYASDADKKRFEALSELYAKDAVAVAEAIAEGEKVAEKKKKEAAKRKTTDKFKRDDKEGKNNGKEPAPHPAVSSNRPLELTEKRNVETTEKHHKLETEDREVNYDSNETNDHKRLQEQWEEDKKDPHLDKDVTVEGNDKGLKDLNKDVNKFDARFNNPFMAYVKANMDEANKGVIDFNAYVQKQNPRVPVGANTKSAKSSISSLYSGIHTLFVPIKPDFQGTWEKTIKISRSITSGASTTTKIAQGALGNSDAKGRNNKAFINSVFSFNSAARGYGRLGPKGKGGPTLTGELGYEIAWLPSENRSMILGADGPQMIDLPGDAVVWTHEQSKKILKQKAIPAGSHYKKPHATGDSSNYTVTYNTSTTSTTSGTPKKTKKTTGTNNGKDKKKEEKTSKKINVWWENIKRNVSAAQRKSEQLGKQLNKTFNDIRASISDVSKVNKDFVNIQKKTISLNEEIRNKYASKLSNLDKGKTKKTIKYKNKKGKTVSKKVSLGKYIKQDPETGAYYVNEAAINNPKNGTRKKRKAIRDKAYELIDLYTDRANEAQDAIDKANEELADYRKEINDAFFGWENELTQVLRITSEIEKTEARINQNQAERDRTEFYMDNIDFSRGAINAISGGHSFNDLWKDYSNQIAQNVKLNQEEINLKNEQIEANKEEMRAAAELTDSLVTYADINGDIKKESEKDMYKRISTIAESGTGTGWDELSTQEKQIFARNELFARGLVTGNAEEGYSLNKDALNTYLGDIKEGKIQSELGELLTSAFNTLNEKTLENIQLATEAYELETDNFKLEQERLDKAKEISEQLYGWKNTLTKILELTNKIEQSEKRTSLLKSGQDYYTAKQRAGYGVDSTDVLSTYIGQMVSTINQIQDREQLLEKRKQDLQDYITGADLSAEITRFTEAYKNNPTDDTIKAQLDNLIKEAKIRTEAQKYVQTTPNADGTVSIVFDSKQLELDKIANGNLVSTDYYNKIEEYAQELVNKNNEIAETMAANVTDITELYTALGDLRQEYADRAKELREAYGAQQQKVIDNLKSLYSAIDNSFKDLINQVKQSIQQRRQIEDNAKTEQDISKKQQRLASLRANTAGGNQVAIAQLEKEIADAQQSYGRTLEDQLLDKISQQGDLAAKQREQQIQLMQAQRDWAAKTGADAEQINQWLQNPEKYKQNIIDVLESESGWAAMTTAEQTAFENSLDTKLLTLNTIPNQIIATQKAIGLLPPEIQKAEGNFENGVITALQTATQNIANNFTTGLSGVGDDLETIGNALGTKLTSTDTEIENIKKNTQAAVDKLQEQLNAVAKTIAEVEKARKKAEEEAAKAAEEAAKAAEEARKAEEAKKSPGEQLRAEAVGLTGRQAELATGTEPGLGSTNAQKELEDAKKQAQYKEKQIKQFEDQIAIAQQNIGSLMSQKSKTKDSRMAANLQTQINTYQARINTYRNTIVNLQNEIRALKNKYKFKKGGLASSTGPAWLDGTPSKPELVLNAADTRNFLALRDVLSKALGSSNSINETNNANFEININVDHLSNDYDVDKVVERVKKKIVQGSSYRNVTQVRNFR